MTLDDVEFDDLRVGATLPADSDVREVLLDGTRVRRPTVSETNRGVEVTVPASTEGRHTVTISTRGRE